MCVRLGTGVWCNPVTKMMISPEPVDHEKHVSLCLLSSFCFSRSHRGWHKSTNCTCKWMHATHANRCHLFNSLQKVFSNLELRAALSSEAFPCMEVCIFFYFTQALIFWNAVDWSSPFYGELQRNLLFMYSVNQPASVLSLWFMRCERQFQFSQLREQHDWAAWPW